MKGIVQFLKDWMLPVAIATGILLGVVFHFIHGLQPYELGASGIASSLQPCLLFAMLFLQFNVIAPSDMKIHKWFLVLLLFQSLTFLLLGFLLTRIPESTGRILLESAVLCLICPTASAAGVIVRKLGGSISDTMTYTVLINLVAAILIPFMIPVVHPSSEVPFFTAFWAIIRRVFSILVLPCALAWLIRYAWPALQKKIDGISGWAFYIWGVCLALSIFMATKSLLVSGVGAGTAVLIALISLVCCLFQFWFGRKTTHRYGRVEELTSGQILGQKNTGFVIWLGYTYMTPVTSIAGGLYSVWQNIVNSAELYEHRKQTENNNQ